MQILKLNSFPIEQVADMNGLERRFGDWWVNRTYPTRLLAYSRRFDMRPAIARIRSDLRAPQQLASQVDVLLSAIDAHFRGDPAADPAAVLQALPADTVQLLSDLTAADPAMQAALDALGTGLALDDADLIWAMLAESLAALLRRIPWMKEQIRLYEALSQRHLRSASYLMLTWEGGEVSASALAATLRHAIGRDVQVLDQLPSPIDGPYLEQATRLQPERATDPWLAVLLAYDMRGTIDATVLHTLMQLNCDLAIAIDIQTLSRNRAMHKAESALSVARTVQRDQQVIDVRAQRVQADAERVLHTLTVESLHLVDIVVLVGGATAEELDANVAQVQGVLGAQLRLMRPAGVQGELLKLWSTMPSVQIDAPLVRRNLLSHGLGCLLGVLGYHRASMADGLFWGLDAMRRAPLFFDLFQNNQAAHMVILGKTGSGKTYFLNLLALRGAALCDYRVIGIDAFRNGTRVEAAAQAGAQCHFLGLETPINILDVIYADDTDGDWRANQVQHAIGQLALLLGTPGTSANGSDRYFPRVFSIPERGVLDRALSALYLLVESGTALDQMPILSDLIDCLAQYQELEARALARELRMLLTGSEEPDAPLNVLGRSFNSHTAIDWNFSRDINEYDVSDVPEQLRPFYYAQVIGAILRDMRDPQRDRRRKTLLQIDEFGYLAQVETLAQLAATICKVARKYGLGLIAIDQNPGSAPRKLIGREFHNGTLQGVCRVARRTRMATRGRPMCEAPSTMWQ